MKTDSPRGEAAEIVSSILSNKGFSLVELAVQTVKGRTHVHCVVYRRGGFNLDELGEIHQQVMPTLEMVLDRDDMHVEFSSPGLDRELKSTYEFGVFQGETARVLLSDTHEWVEGTIESSDNDKIDLRTTDGTSQSIQMNLIQKARLVS